MSDPCDDLRRAHALEVARLEAERDAAVTLQGSMSLETFKRIDALETERDEARREKTGYAKLSAAESKRANAAEKRALAAEASVDELRRAAEAMLAEYDRAFPKGQDVRTLRALPGARWFAAAEALRAALRSCGATSRADA